MPVDRDMAALTRAVTELRRSVDDHVKETKQINVTLNRICRLMSEPFEPKDPE